MSRAPHIASTLTILSAALCLLNATAGIAQQPDAETLPAPPNTSSAPTQVVMTQEELAAEIARLRYHLYRRVEYPLRLSQLDAAITLAHAEVESLDRQIDEFERISRPHTSHPFLVTLESARMRRLATELRLKQLRREKILVIQSFQTERQLRALEIAAGMR
jgi:hypothetical protein